MLRKFAFRRKLCRNSPTGLDRGFGFCYPDDDTYTYGQGIAIREITKITIKWLNIANVILKKQKMNFATIAGKLATNAAARI